MHFRNYLYLREQNSGCCARFLHPRRRDMVGGEECRASGETVVEKNCAKLMAGTMDKLCNRIFNLHSKRSLFENNFFPLDASKLHSKLIPENVVLAPASCTLHSLLQPWRSAELTSRFKSRPRHGQQLQPNMGEFFHKSCHLDKGHVFIRNVLGAFGKRDGERSSCPRCDCSGLLHGQKSWLWNHATYSKDPCWFCEGVGVMPIYGLRGFLLGRASASFKTEDPMKSIASPFQMHLCLAKYPDAKCKIGAVKSSEKIGEFLYNWSESPSWLIDAATELAVNSEYDDKGVILPDGGEGFNSSRRMGTHLDSSGLPSHCDQDRPMETSNMVDRANLSSVKAQIAIMGWTALIRRKLSGLAGGRMKYDTVAGPFYPGGHSFNSRPRAADVKNFEVPKQIQIVEVTRELRSRKTNFRRTRLARRNRIREQAEREARERARWFLRLKPSNSEDATSSIPSDQSDAPRLSSSVWRKLSSKWIAEETALFRQSKQSAQLKPQGAPNPPSVNQILYARLVDKLPFIPNFIKLHI